MNTTGTRLRRPAHMAALGLAALIGTPLLTTTVAHAGPRSTGQYVVDVDTIALSATDGRLDATTTTFVEDGHVQVELDGWVDRTTAGTTCLFSEVTWYYADGSTTTSDPKTAYRACLSHNADASAYRWSDPDRDVVRYDVSLRSAPDMTSRGLALKSTYQFVGDSPDSLGKAERLDRDIPELTRSGTSLFTGTTDYAIARNYASIVSGQDWTVQAKLGGRLQWTSALRGTSATLLVRLGYFDGSSRTVEAAKVTPTSTVDYAEVSSDIMREVASVQVCVKDTLDPCTSLGSTLIGTNARFGDYLAALR